MVFLAVCSQRELGVRGRLQVRWSFAAVFAIALLRPLPRFRSAACFQSAIISATACRTFKCCLPSADEVVQVRSRTLTKWFSSTRLETRTKESTSIASVRVTNLYAE